MRTHSHVHETPWEPAISGFGAASHDHGSHQSGNSKSLISKLATKIKSVDGIDETASLAGQILPGIAGPIATATILAVSIPFVWLGVLGMKEEYTTACEEFNEIAHRRVDVETKITEMMYFAQSKRKILKDKFALEIKEASEAGSQNAGSILGLAHFAAEHQTLENKKLIAALGKKFGWTGLVGMSGMFAGMLPATAAAGLEIANEISASAALESAAVALELAAGSCFLVGQAAMAVYSANRGYQGLKAKEILEKLKQIFESNCNNLNFTTVSHVKEIIDKQIKFIEKHSIEYAKLTAAGQIAMITGTALGMTGFGLIATIPLFGIGAPLTVGGALQRIYYQDKEKKFKGKNTPFANERIIAANPILLFTRFFEEAVSETDIDHCSDENILKTLDNKVLKELDEKFNETTTQLAAIKCYSLLHHVVNSKKSSPQKIKYLESRTNHLLDGLRNTGLEKSVIEKMSVFYSNNKVTFNKIIASSNANQLISNDVMKILNTTPKELGLDNEFLKPPYKDQSRKLLAAAKSSLKSARFFTADSIIRVSQTIEARKILSLNDEGKNFNENYTSQNLFGDGHDINSCDDAGCQATYHPVVMNSSAGNATFSLPVGKTIPLKTSCGDASCGVNHNTVKFSSGDNVQFCAPTTSSKKRKPKSKIEPSPSKFPEETSDKGREKTIAIHLQKAPKSEQIKPINPALNKEWGVSHISSGNDAAKEEKAQFIDKIQNSKKNGAVKYSHKYRPLNVSEIAENSYNTLKKSLQNYDVALSMPNIKEQQKNLDNFRQNAEEFILERKFKDGQGNTIYLWDNPVYPEQKEYRITYIVNDRTGKMAVKYGSEYLKETSPTAIVASDSDISLGVGVRILEIGKGQHIALGDVRNGRIDVEASGLSIVHTEIASAVSHKKSHNSFVSRYIMNSEWERAAR